MRLKTLRYVNRLTGWELAPMEFFPDLTLLVGVSGVGKTMLLGALTHLAMVANGDPFAFGEWQVSFTSDQGVSYLWSGETRDGILLRELLVRDGETIIDRDVQRILLRGVATPKLPRQQSAIAILNREEGISEAYESLRQILAPDDERRDHAVAGAYAADRRTYRALADIRRANLPTSYKLALLHAAAPTQFQQIVQRFRSIFPQVEAADIRIDKIGDAEYPALQIKEVGCQEWFTEHQISSGMLRTLYHLARMELWPDGTVILIDEFENSLGVNCIDFVTSDLVRHSGRLQFIITSHHPYIVNNISPANWKVLTRKGSVVTAADAVDLGIGRSRHQAFIQLINSEAFREGIAAP